ncbi:hypothetical protein O3M35_010465 [Rhynocoris fuscipes]|uniref:Fanconi anemia group M protein n=1 Tax=Rhynocoris fuscipes TaxID=488301 RepID=A0AAW1D0A0_9HEMI
MDDTLADLLEGNEDDILAKVQAESLRFYNEVELPRLQLEKQVANENHLREEPLEEEAKPSCSRANIEKEATVLYEGEEAPGFHLTAGSTYIYPTNYPIRQYQSNITKTALFKNTLVTLPTGLGKTFIAAVVMYNYYRWYPKGKVVFMAPTRPLVAQQIKACHHIMNIPVSDTTEMTGLNNADQRKILWKEKRVFFLTPQVMVNDLKSGLCPPNLVKCIVFDEAHRAVKDYAYCQVVKLMAAAGAQYRTLALSATPGSDINAVQQVIRNLNISILEIRGEDSLDVAPYTHSKSVEKVVVELSPNILRVKEDFLQIYDKYARRLKDFKALNSNISVMSKFQVLKACEKFRNNPPRNIPSSVLGSLICDFTVCMSLAHSLELLQTYGLRAFHSYLKNEGGEKCSAAITRLKNDEDLQRMLEQLNEILYPKAESHRPYTWGHPKLQKLVFTLNEHFNKNETTAPTKAIVFCQYRVVVNEIVNILSKCPNIKAAIFIGQSGGKDKGMTQQQQLQIMKDFREGRLNCLVATCVAEEGLDIGEVDLILLMEAQKSPVRLVQRLGRTGRKRKGRCVVFLTQGKELEKFHSAMAARKGYVNNIINSEVIKSSLCQYSPAMIPSNINPKQQLVHIVATELVSPAKAIKKKQASIKNICESEQSPFLSAEQFNEIKSTVGLPDLNFNKLPKRIEIWHKDNLGQTFVDELLDGKVSALSCWNDWNTAECEAYLVSHTYETKSLCHLLSLAKNKEQLGKMAENYELNKALTTFNESPSKKKRPNEVIEISPSKSPRKTVKESKSPSKKKKMGKNKIELKQNGNQKTNKIIEIIDLVDEDTLSPPPQNNLNSPAPVLEDNDNFLDALGKLFELDQTFNDKIKQEKELFSFPQKIHKMNSTFNHYLNPKSFKVKYCTIIPKDDLPDLDAIKNKLNCLVIEEKKSKFNEKEIMEERIQADNEVVEEMLFFDEKMINSSCLKESEKINNEEQDNAMDLDDEFVVSVDDLFEDGSDLENFALQDIEIKEVNHAKTNENLSVKNCKNIEKINQLIIPNRLKGSNNSKTSTPVQNPNDNEEIWEDTPDVLKKMNNFSFETSKIVCSTPLNSKIKDKDLIETVSLEKNSVHEADEEGVWNLSDLFDSDSDEKKMPIISTCNSTMVGITQMVNDIEKIKEEKHNLNCRINQKNLETKSQKTPIVSIPEYLLKTPPTVSKEDEIKYNISNDKIKNSSISSASESPVNNSFKNSILEFILKTPPNQIKSKTPSKLNNNNIQTIANETDNFKNNFTETKLLENTIIEENANNSRDSSQRESLKPNFKTLTQLMSQNTSLNDTINSEFSFTTHRTQQNSKPNFNALKRKSLFKLNHNQESNLAVKPIVENCNNDNLTNNNNLENANEQKSNFSKSSSSSLNLKPKNDISKELKTKISESSRNSKFFDDSDEDDIFETSAFKTQKKAKDSSFEMSSSPSPIKKPSKKFIKKQRNDFIENEADVSGLISSDDSDNSSLDDLDESFINDEPNSIHPANDTHLEYLKSIKSPPGGIGKFKIPICKPCDMDVFSQQVEQDTDYFNDSFCVGTSEEEIEEEEISELELAERMLNLKRKNKKTNNLKIKSSDSSFKQKKRRRIKTPEPAISPTQNFNKTTIEISDDEDDVKNINISGPKSKRPKIIFSDSDCDSPFRKRNQKKLVISPT